MNDKLFNIPSHLEIHSCPCEHLALFYLGITEKTGLYWPDGKGDNQWKA